MRGKWLCEIQLGFFIGLVVLAVGCARLHPGRIASPVDANEKEIKGKKAGQDMVVSVDKDKQMSSDHFKLLHVTIENKSSDWLRFERVLIDFGSPQANQKILVVYGNDIVQWYDATVSRLAFERYNRAAFLGALAVAGAVTGAVGAATDSEGLENAGRLVGATAALGLATSMTADMIGDQLDALQNAQLFPENHLMASSIDIPPGLFTKKWVLLETKIEDWKTQDRLLLEFTHKNGKVETFVVNLPCRTPASKKYNPWDPPTYRSQMHPSRCTPW